MNTKLAVIFPGVGYHTDKPLLYHSKKIALSHGYEIRDVPYGNFPSGVKGDQDKMKTAFYDALAQSEEILQDVDYAQYDEILFLSKSIGTAIASAYGQNHGLRTCNVYFTPVAESFQFMTQPGIVFHGTKDSWVDTAVVKEECEQRSLPLYIIENANHSLETGDWARDLEILERVMRTVDEYFFSDKTAKLEWEEISL